MDVHPEFINKIDPPPSTSECWELLLFCSILVDSREVCLGAQDCLLNLAMSRFGHANWAERIARISAFLLLAVVALQYIVSGESAPAPAPKLPGDGGQASRQAGKHAGR